MQYFLFETGANERKAAMSAEAPTPNPPRRAHPVALGCAGCTDCPVCGTDACFYLEELGMYCTTMLAAGQATAAATAEDLSPPGERNVPAA